MKVPLAKIALEAVSVPGALSSPGLSRASNHTIGIGDEMVDVAFGDKPVDGMARGTRAAPAAFKVQQQGSLANELLLAVSSGARYTFGEVL